MSFQWTLIAGYLYLEILVVIILMLPLMSITKWHKLFKSRLFAMFQDYIAVYFCVLLGVLALFLIDAVREMRKYSHSLDASHLHLTSEMKGNVKLFRAQRNFYITGFAIFLSFVIRRLIKMIMLHSELLERTEKIIKEAEEVRDLASTAILARTHQAGDTENHEMLKNQLEITETLLKEEKNKVKSLEEEITKWKVKYENIVSTNGKGDK